jgi:hypothetical protein
MDLQDLILQNSRRLRWHTTQKKQQLLNWEYIQRRLGEYLRTRLDGRIVIKLNDGAISGVYDQPVITSGITQTEYYIRKTH